MSDENIARRVRFLESHGRVCKKENINGDIYIQFSVPSPFESSRDYLRTYLYNVEKHIFLIRLQSSDYFTTRRLDEEQSRQYYAEFKWYLRKQCLMYAEIRNVDDSKKRMLDAIDADEPVESVEKRLCVLEEKIGALTDAIETFLDVKNSLSSKT